MSWLSDILDQVFGKKADKPGNVVSENKVGPVAPNPSSVPGSVLPVGGVQVAPAKKVPTRDEMLAVLKGLIEGTIPNRLGFPYKNIREDKGKNRSIEIDKISKKQGGALGDPYCIMGSQEILDELCDHYKVDRKLVEIPEGASTQTVWENTPKKYKSQEPDAMKWVTWRKGSTWTGHNGTCLGKLANGVFPTFEFNTSAGGPGVERDGEGTAYKSRDMDGYGDTKIRGFTDVYQAIVDAMNKQVKASPLA